ncbi:glycoside hydrolase family 2 sugar binding protein [Podospora didyma]|uniref:Glycoside hydrolase family 2 sugar binding protein n=1 Tax=Podospora didyma TaxID=330526 RepID=A0AAE0NUM9_9PEZI|nr:glycoside hydrolase family 2 sugar binding protein [Podospora didyma]
MASFHWTLTQALATGTTSKDLNSPRERINIYDGWRFQRWAESPDKLAYDKRSDITDERQLLKPWVLPSMNDFVLDPTRRHPIPTTSPDLSSVPFIQKNFDDSAWEHLSLPHDWAIKGPFYTEEVGPVVGGGMGRLPVQGVAWYRRKLTLDAADKGKSIFLDIDGAMSHAVVWVNGHLVGGWPYGYTSFRLDLTPYLEVGEGNQLAIRLDNPVASSRWYPGAGIYRNVWITKADPVHVAQWGTFITSREVSQTSAMLDLQVRLENKVNDTRELKVTTTVYEFDPSTETAGKKVATFPPAAVKIQASQTDSINSSVKLPSPRLWEPRQNQDASLYIAVTQVYSNNDNLIDTYTTRFGIRSVTYSGDNGLLVNGKHVRIQGVNQHHDLGSLGTAFNLRAAERQLETLRELGANAIRMSHNPPAPELLDLTDRMGFLVINEAFDCWEVQKNPNDYHLLFPDWHEADLRSLLRRDRNHPSIIAWSIGNEVGEQYTDVAGAAIAQRLTDIVHQEDPNGRPSTASMNYAKPDMPFPAALDILNLNYQGEGIRDTPAYAGLEGIKTPPLYPAFHAALPEKLLLASESAASLSTRGAYLFPVTNESSAPQTNLVGGGGDPLLRQVSAYELYTAPFGASPDKVFSVQDNNSFVAGEFVWSGWDYLGEPTPYYTARSSYFGIIDLAGFKKDRFWLYQARWRPDLKVVHILPHWSWGAERFGKVTPVHVFTAAEEGELFVNGRSQGRRKRGGSEYRLRWDEVIYEPGEVRAVTYKGGKEWARSEVRTVGEAKRLGLRADREIINGGAKDLAFVTLEVLDGRGQVVPTADHLVTFEVVSGPGEIVATDNGDPYSMVSFSSKERKAFNGLGLVAVKASRPGRVVVKASARGLVAASVTIMAR